MARRCPSTRRSRSRGPSAVRSRAGSRWRGSRRGRTTRYQDGDGYGHGGHWQYACNRPGGYTNNGIDCHDSNAAINPGQPESCLDTIDNNCDGYIAPYCGGPTNPNPNPCNGDPLCHEP
ncbi:putative metal-binding motif-containing protein [Myxococcus faecalis]|uniref:putative metal-binding motif-containing protein n=1 Tax=Myxococcus faecalis TaxID=3115646 RepID=UPI003CF7315E